MSSISAWMISLTLSLCVIILAAGANNSNLHMYASGAVSLIFAILAVREHRQMLSEGASQSALGGSTARFCGLVWTWGAIGLLVTYALILEQRWPEWKYFFLSFVVAGAASLMFAKLLDRDAAEGKDDPMILKFGRTLVLAQFVGMAIALFSLLADGKFPRAITFPDWAAQHIFFFGAAAIAAISLNALLASNNT